MIQLTVQGTSPAPRPQPLPPGSGAHCQLPPGVGDTPHPGEVTGNSSGEKPQSTLPPAQSGVIGSFQATADSKVCDGRAPVEHIAAPRSGGPGSVGPDPGEGVRKESKGGKPGSSAWREAGHQL